MITLFFCIIYIIIGMILDFQLEICESYSIIGIILTSFTLLYSLKSIPQTYHKLFLIGYILRIGLLLLDYYHIFPIIHSGADSETFYWLAKKNIILANKISYENYILFLSYLFDLIGPQRLFVQYLNVIFGFFTMIYVYKSLQLFNVDQHKKKLAIYTIAFMPHMIIFSSILLREAILIFFATLSIYSALAWIKQKKVTFVVLSISSILISTYLHSGMIGMLIGIVLLFMTYDHHKKKASINHKSILPLVFLGGIILVLLLKTDLFTGYFQSTIDKDTGNISEELLLKRVNSDGDAGSAYLTSLTYTSPFTIIMYLPLKVLYFLFSPMPWDWRGIGDFIAFILDSPFYIILLYTLYRNKRRIKDKTIALKSSISTLMIGFWLSIILYSFGTIASGTALRHRANFFPALVIFSALSTTYNYEGNSTKLKNDDI